MQSVERLNGMVCKASPVAAHEKDTFNNVVVSPDMALRLANLTKSLSRKQMHKKNGLSHLASSSSTNEVQKTEAVPTTQQEVTSSTHPVLSSAQNFISRHCSSVVQSSSTRLSSTQVLLEQRLKNSLKKLRHNQLRLSHKHTKNQIKAYKEIQPCVHNINQLEESTTDSTSTNTSMDSSCANSSVGVMAEVPSKVQSKIPSREVFGSLQQHLQCLESFIDDEATSTSSDEEEEIHSSEKPRSERYLRKEAIKQRWERDRTKLGSQWAWLCHQITTLNQKLYQLDSLIQSQPKESVQLISHNPFNVPCVCGLQNGHLDSTHNNKRGNGSTLPPLPKQSKSPHLNGVTTPCTCQVRQMLLSNPSLVTQSVQVRELLGYSFPVLLMNESNQTCARTRSIQSSPRRKILRNRRTAVDDIERGVHVDASHHPFLSKPEDVQSDLWLDDALHDIVQEHPYASLPRVPKRKKTTNNVPPLDSLSLNRPLLRLERSKSFSPSPLPFDTGERNSKGLPKKRHSANTPLTFSEDFSHPSTPIALKKKKGLTTPQYDIDNIVPYSFLPSSSRLEKLEYKEIITPKWRKVDLLRNGDVEETKHSNGKIFDINGKLAHVNETVKINGEEHEHEVDDEIEDVSDEIFTIRHDRCETKERSRYLNFITGNRKRPRLSHADSSSMSPPLPGTPPPLEMDETVPQVLPWSPRKFPLVGKDLQLLKNPVPPPKRTIQFVPILDCSHSSSSPSPLPHHASCSTPPHNSNNNVLVSPTTPTTTDECPLWTVDTHIKSFAYQPSIVLKLTKQAL